MLYLFHPSYTASIQFEWYPTGYFYHKLYESQWVHTIPCSLDLNNEHATHNAIAHYQPYLLPNTRVLKKNNLKQPIYVAVAWRNNYKLDNYRKLRIFLNDNRCLISSNHLGRNGKIILGRSVPAWAEMSPNQASEAGISHQGTGQHCEYLILASP